MKRRASGVVLASRAIERGCLNARMVDEVIHIDVSPIISQRPDARRR